MPVINPDKPYPGTEAECTDSPGLQRLLEQIQTTNVNLLISSFVLFKRNSCLFSSS